MAGGSYLVGYVQAIALSDEGSHCQSGPAGKSFRFLQLMFL